MNEQPTSDTTTDRNVERYLGAVADHLGVLGLPPDRSGQHLAEMAAHLEDSGADPWAEYGTPERYARSLAEADGRPARPLGLRALAAGVSAAALAIGFILLFRGRRPTELHWASVVSLVPFAAIAGCSATVWGARMRDAQLPGSPNRDRSARLVLSWAGGAAVLAALVSGVANAQLGERRSVWPGVPSWATGLALVAVGAVAAAASSRLPRFPAGSGLQGSRFARRVRLR